MRFAIIEKGVVVNVVLAEKPLEDGWVATEVAGPGWLYQDGQFIAPPEPLPTREQQGAARQAAFASEADPMFFQWQAGEATEEEWKAKRQEIRDRYPYPDEKV
jgi:hypothetical protein